MNNQYRSIHLVAAAVLMSAAGLGWAAAAVPADDLAQAQAECASHNARLRSLEAQHAEAAQIKSERDAYEHACARAEILRGTPPGTPSGGEVTATKVPPARAHAPAPATTTSGGDCTQKQ